MSDARPITNITDFVCGSCWNSFSRDDPGVLRDARVICPHCGHVLPVGTGDDPVAEAVRAAPSMPLTEDSETYPSHPLTPEDPEGFPSLEAVAAYGWEASDVASSPEPAGFMVGEPDDFDFNEQTLRPDISHRDLLEAVRNAPPAFDPDSWSGSLDSDGYVAGEELSADVDEPTPVDAAALETAAAAERAVVVAGGETADPTIAAMDTSPGIEVADVEAAIAAAAGEPEPEEDVGLEHSDWKLRAMGLTYNFHGLDALIGWASNKAGQQLSVSVDGVVWKDFGSFFQNIKDGLKAQQAFALAVEPGAPHVTQPNTRATGTRPAGPPVPDLQVVSTVAAAPTAETPAVDKPAQRQAQEPAPAATAAAGRKSPPAAAKGNGAALGTSNPSRRVPASPATSPSRRTPVAAARPQAEKAEGGPARVALAVVVLAVVVAALLHVQGVLHIPGLP